MPKPTEPHIVAACRRVLLGFVEHAHAACLVRAYFDPTGPFAAGTFDAYALGPPNEITAGDLIAVGFLDVKYPVLAVRQIEDAADEYRCLLEAVGPDADLWDADDDQLDAADQVWHHLCKYPGVKKVLAGKLLARKRPRLIPIVDKWTEHALAAVPKDGMWVTIRGALDEELRCAIDKIRPETAPPETSTLRILDAAIWMQHSNGAPAKKARRKCGCTGAVLGCTT